MAKEKISLYLEKKEAQALRELASQDIRSVANTAEMLIIEGLRARGLLPK